MAQPTRFHSNKGELVSPRNLLNAPRSLVQAVLRKALGRHPRLPWLPFSVIRRLDSIIRPDWKVVEIGSGMSTLWLAARCRSVTSVEAGRKWHARLSDIIESKGLTHVDLRFEMAGHIMSDFSEHEDGSLDLVIVDGGPREDCVRNALEKIRPGGYIYVDNTDDRKLVGAAEQILLEWVDGDERYHEYHVDFLPGSFWVVEGLLAQRPTG